MLARKWRTRNSVELRLDGLAADEDFVPSHVDLQFVDLDDFLASPSSSSSACSAAALPAQHRPHPRQQDLRTERLGHVIVGPEVQAADDVRLLAFGGEHDDRHGLGPRIVPQSLADGQAVDAGKHQVQEDQIGRSRLGGRQGLLARRHARHLVAFLQQMVADQFPDVLLILDDEHGFLDHSASTARTVPATSSVSQPLRSRSASHLR